MKKNIYLFIYLLFIINCKSQDHNKLEYFNIKSKDVIIFTGLKNTQYYYNNEVIHHDNKNIIVTQDWEGYGSLYFNKQYSFIQNKDTMNIKCFCGQEINYYFKNLEFRKGNYKLSFNFGKEYNRQTKKYDPIRPTTYGYQIKTQKEVQNFLFKNSYDPNEEPEQKDRYFKDIMFYKIDLKDTLHVNLQKTN